MKLISSLFGSAPAPTEQPKGIIPEGIIPVHEQIPDDYAVLAKRAGFISGTAIAQEHAFEKFLAENGICVYTHAKVRSYLGSLCGTEQSPMWWGVSGGILWDDFTNTGLGTRPPYDKPIPVPALETMATIRDKFPDVLFWVSHISDVIDPFLAAQINNKFYIIERWDEPGFRM